MAEVVGEYLTVFSDGQILRLMYGTVISYNLYWLLVIISFLVMRYHEVRGKWPLMRPKKPVDSSSGEWSEQSNSTSIEVGVAEIGVAGGKMAMKEEITTAEGTDATVRIRELEC